jgi:protein gp37
LVLAHEKTQNMRRDAAGGSGGGLPNVWLGTTAENQEESNRRIPQLVAIPAAVRFRSVDPMVEPVDFAQWLVPPL